MNTVPQRVRVAARRRVPPSNKDTKDRDDAVRAAAHGLLEFRGGRTLDEKTFVRMVEQAFGGGPASGAAPAAAAAAQLEAAVRENMALRRKAHDLEQQLLQEQQRQEQPRPPGRDHEASGVAARKLARDRDRALADLTACTERIRDVEARLADAAAQATRRDALEADLARCNAARETLVDQAKHAEEERQRLAAMVRRRETRRLAAVRELERCQAEPTQQPQPQQPQQDDEGSADALVREYRRRLRLQRAQLEELQTKDMALTVLVEHLKARQADSPDIQAVLRTLALQGE